VADRIARANEGAGSSAVFGRRIVITRAVEQSSDLVTKLERRGAIPISLPLVAFSTPENFAPLDAALRRWQEFDWVLFTSVNAVQSVAQRAAATNRGILRPSSRPQIAAVGPATNEAAVKAGLHVTYVAKTHLGLALAEELAQQLRNKSVFLPRSDRANPDLPAALKKLGATVTEVVAYHTLPPTNVDRARVTEVLDENSDAALFFSPSAVNNLADLVGRESLTALQSKITIAAVGPVTTAALRDHGVTNLITAADTTTDAIIAALENHFAQEEKKLESTNHASGATHG
jgi:uroporphyrinogen III methyltransferase / synthase